MVIRPELILYRSQDAFTTGTFTNPYPHRIRKHYLKLHSIDVYEMTRYNKTISFSQNIKLAISNDVQRARHLIKLLINFPSSKKLSLEINVKGFEDPQRSIKKFNERKQLIKQLFTVAKRIRDLQITLVDPYYIIVKDLP